VEPSGITIKGIRDSLLIVLGDGPWEEVEQALFVRIASQGDFFRGARVALQLEDRPLDDEDIRKLSDKLAEHDLTLWAVLGKSPQTMRAARRLELETELPEPESLAEEETATELPPIEPDEKGSSGVLVRHTLRSGRVVRHAGHVVVVGDVNPGAHIIAGGDVLVWGRLLGTVHAGASGDESAVVCALDMRPMQLRIARHIAISPEHQPRRPRPEVASVRNGQIVAEEWVS
jgi:septum site-determining protein MinC